jgi:lysophospholipid acyltransferase (LPLAT)-like uncharacterized protein
MPDPDTRIDTKIANALEEQESARSADASARLAENPRTFTPWERAQIFFATWVGTHAVSLIGSSLRWETMGWENWEAARKLGKGIIFTFWHREIVAATWFWRKRGIVVMTSRNFDGEYIARIIQKHGYGAARGSSSRGAVRALVEMIKSLKDGRDAAFTVDGPRGPRFVAKPGPVLLAKASGAPVLCFHIALRRAFVFHKSWDLNQIPYPFSRAATFIAAPILVPPDADEAEQTRRLQDVQAALDELQKRGDEWAKASFRNPKSETGNS